MVLLTTGGADLGSPNQNYVLLDVFYQGLKNRILGSGGPGISRGSVTLLCHTDLDAICTLKIIVFLLKSDLIPYEIIPVASYSDFKEIDTSNMQSVICINVGGMVNLVDFFDLTNNPNTKWWVFDSHRPLNLHNLFASPQVVVIDDGTIADDIKGLKVAFESIEFESEDEDSSSSDDETDDTAIVKDPTPEDRSDPDQADEDDSDKDLAERVDESGRYDTNDNDSDDDPDREENPINSPLKRKSLSPMKDRKKRQKSTKRAYKNEIASYYGQGTGFGTPIAGILYNLACEMGRQSNDLLWFSILSSTNNYIHGKSSVLDYTALAKVYKDEVDRLTINHELPVNENGISIPANPNVEKADDFRIEFVEDYQLILLRHWNLYDSLFHSTYVGTKLGVWKEKGRQRLTNLLVKMGFPQKESRQTYKEMSVDFKKALPNKLLDLAPKYNMPDIIFPSFSRKHGLFPVASASDAVYSVTAILDCGSTWLNQSGVSGYEAKLSESLLSSVSSTTFSAQAKNAFQDITEKGDGGLIGAGVGTRTESASIGSAVFEKVTLSDQDGRPEWVRHFYLSYDALSSPQLLQHGILLAIHNQRLLVQTAMSILEKRMVKSLKSFQLVILKTSGDGDSKIFGSSVPMLYRLTSFLVEAYQIHKDRRLPFVCVAYNHSSNSYLVMGRAVHASRKNPFGLAFLEAAERTDVELQHDFFDSSCVKVASDDLEPFLENLQLTMV